MTRRGALAAPPIRTGRHVDHSRPQGKGALHHRLDHAACAGAGLDRFVGLVAIFLVDFLNLFYISLLDDPSLTAAVGYASALVYFYVSLSVGMMIAATALVSRALGAENRPHAREVAGSAMVWLACRHRRRDAAQPALRATRCCR